MSVSREIHDKIKILLQETSEQASGTRDNLRQMLEELFKGKKQLKWEGLHPRAQVYPHPVIYASVFDLEDGIRWWTDVAHYYGVSLSDIVDDILDLVSPGDQAVRKFHTVFDILYLVSGDKRLASYSRISDADPSFWSPLVMGSIFRGGDLLKRVKNAGLLRSDVLAEGLVAHEVWAGLRGFGWNLDPSLRNQIEVSLKGDRRLSVFVKQQEAVKFVEGVCRQLKRVMPISVEVKRGPEMGSVIINLSL